MRLVLLVVVPLLLSASPAVAGEFKPSLVAGKKVSPKGATVSFRLARGWTGQWVEQDGEQAYQMVPADRAGTIAGMSRLLSREDAARPMPELLREGAMLLLGDAAAAAQVVVAPEAFTVNGRRAGRLVVRIAAGGQNVEGYLGAVLLDRWAYIFVGVYPADRAADFRAVADTILATFRGKAPQQNAALARRLVGCWESYDSTSDNAGSGSSTTRWWFDGDGNYRYAHNTYMSVAGASASRENADAGVFSVFGTTISTQSNEGGDGSYQVSWKGKILFLNGVKYLPCS